GRIEDSQLTLYKSVGVAVQDAAAAALVLKAAWERGVGIEISI
ncbi:MAG: Ornithine cyclodeaminase/mu-crystallin family, partial [Pseudonocardiales bacterium]|nr:Ornithine cyclodeaminase/mu-crystallin family [Pseudonocardiales bacterium]